MTEEPPFISVIVPTHARKASLARLRSAGLSSIDTRSLSSTIGPVRTQELVADFVAITHPPILYYRKNYKGLAASRQFAAGMAPGSILAFIDDDCEADANWRKAGEAAMKPDVGVVQCGTIPAPDQPRRCFEKDGLCDRPDAVFRNVQHLLPADVSGFSPDFFERFFGEDTGLGWKVIAAGWMREFAEAATAFHEIFSQSIWAS